jgi:hypothetical protein
MNVAIDFILQPLVLVCTLNCTSVPTTATEQVTGVVDPTSKVELSVNCTVAAFQTAMTSPDLAFAPLAAVYLKKADVYEPDACVNKLFDPTTDELTVA